MSNQLGVILVSGGNSTRFGLADKQTAELRGMPVFAHALRVFEDSPLVQSIIVVFSDHNIEPGRAYIREHGFTKVTGTVLGGSRRQDSVKNGLDVLLANASCDYVAVHDGARPFVDEAMIERGLSEASRTGAAVAAVRSKDTIKVVGADRRVLDTPDRSTLWAVQTPQVFRTGLLLKAHEEIGGDVTDDASMIERLGERVSVFEGDYTNVKITTPEDMRVAEALYDLRTGLPSFGGGPFVQSTPATTGDAPEDESSEARYRWGIGFDGHRLVEGGPLRLGGVDVPFQMHLAGHSDGDVLLHAIASALLGAAGLGDLGRHFPSTDPKWAGADSGDFIKHALSMYEPLGWVVDHLDATIIAQRPRLSEHVEKMQRRIAAILGVPAASVNVKVTSTDHVGSIGAGEGIAAQAAATIYRP